MITILLSILKIVGLVLLYTLLFLLAVIFLILFFPISYKVNGSKQAEDISFKATVTWLFGFLYFTFKYPEPKKPVLRVLGINLLKNKFRELSPEELAKKQAKNAIKAAKKAKKLEKKALKEQKKAEKKKNSSDAINTGLLESQEETTFYSPKREEDKGYAAKNASSENINTDDQNTDEEKESFWDKLEDLPEILEGVFDKISGIVTKVQEGKGTVDFYLNLIQKPRVKTFIAALLKKVGKLLKHILPKRLKADVTFGAATPDTTGQVFGAYCAFSGLPILSETELVPDFENEILDGTVLIKGRIFLIYIVVIGIKIIIDKNLWYLLKQIKRGGKTNGR